MSAQICYSAIDAWERIAKQHPDGFVTYTSFTRWVRNLGMNTRLKGIDQDGYNLLVMQAEMRKLVPNPRHGDKTPFVLNALKAIGTNDWRGRDLLDLAIATRACKKATLYRRAKSLLSESFSTSRIYTSKEARALVTGGK